MLTLDEVLTDVANSPGFSGANKIEVNSRGDNGQTPLHWMATLGDSSAIRLLLEAEASINAVDSNGNTPLHEAIIWRQTLAADLLINYGADTHLKNYGGLTAIDLAISDNFEPIVKLLKAS